MIDFLSTKRTKTQKDAYRLKNKENISNKISYTAPLPDEMNILKLKDGKIIVDETELYVRKTHLQGPVIVEDEYKPVTSATYAIKKCGKKWNVNDTARFFKALGEWGIDFSVISKVFPNRTRKEIKNKFNMESKRNKEKVDYILKNWKGFDWENWEKLDKCDD